jgi:hypothetical protein
MPAKHLGHSNRWMDASGEYNRLPPNGQYDSRVCFCPNCNRLRRYSLACLLLLADCAGLFFAVCSGGDGACARSIAVNPPQQLAKLPPYRDEAGADCGQRRAAS